MEKYYREGKEFEKEYDEDGVLIYDSYDDYDDSRESDNCTTEYDDEGYPVAKYIDTMVDPKTPTEIEAEERVQRKVTVCVIVGCLMIVAFSFWLAILTT